MSRPLRIIALLFLLAVALLLAGYVFLDVILDRYRPFIEARIERETGMSFKIGTIDLNLIPDLALRLSEVEVEPDPAACRVPIRLQQLDLLLDLFSLRSKRIRITHLRFVEPEAALLFGDEGAVLKPRAGPCVPTPVETPDPAALPAALHGAGDYTDADIEEISVSGGKLELSRFDRSAQLSSIEFHSGLLLEGGRILFRAPKLSISSGNGSTLLEGDEVSYDRSDGRLTLGSIVLSDGEHSLNLNGAVFRRGSVESLDLRLHRTEIPALMRRLHHLLIIRTVPAISGSIDGAFSVSGDLEGRASIDGSVTVSKLAAPALQLELAEGSFSGLSARIDPADGMSVSSRIELRDVSLKARERYGAGTIAGRAEVKRSAAGIKLGADLDVSAFSFDDGATVIQDVDAALKKIAVSITPEGDVTAGVALEGRRGMLRHEAVEVREIKKIGGPLTVRVPAAGGYEIKGPIAAEGGVVRTIGHQFEAVRGRTTILITGPLKEFVTPELSARAIGETIRGSSTFRMTAERFEIGKTVIDGESFHIVGDASIRRGERKQLHGKLKLHDSNVATLGKIYDPADPPGLPPAQMKRLQLAGGGEWSDLTGTFGGSGSYLLEREQGAPPAGTAALIGGALNRIPVLHSVSQIVFQDTTRRTCAGTISAERGVARFPDLLCKTGRYTLEADVSLALSGELEGRGEVVLLRDTARSLGLGLNFLNGLFSQVAQVKIPLAFGGRLPDVSAGVDMTEFVKRYSGYSTAASLFGGLADLGAGVGNFVLNPFRSKPQPAPSPIR